MKIKQIFQEYPQGFSINFNGLFLQTPTNGFMVSLTNNKILEEDIDTVFKRVCIFLEQLSFNGNLKFIGGWTDDKGIKYLDGSIWVNTLMEALTIGKLFRQLSIYDCKNKECIEVL